jgi:hypothetical protein
VGVFQFALLAGFGLAALGAALVLDGPALVVAWSVEAALLSVQRDAERKQPALWPAIGSLALYGAAVVHLLFDEAPLSALTDGVPDDLDAALALAALAASAGAAASLVPRGWRDLPAGAVAAAGAYAVALFTGGEASIALWAALAAGACLAARPFGAPALSPVAWGILGLAVGYGLAEVATASAGSADDVWPVLASVGAITAASAAIAVGRGGAERTAALLLALAAPAYASLLLLDGPAETYALGALTLLAARLPGVAAWRRALLAGLLLAVTTGQALIVEAHPAGLASGTDDLLAAVACLSVVAAAAMIASTAFRNAGVRIGERIVGLFDAAAWVAAAAVVYAGSLAVVELVGGAGSTLGLAGIEQPAQVALSAYWAIVGVVAIVVGLRIGRRTVRTAGLALIGLALAKIFVLDLSSLDASYRAVSFIAVGLLMLLAAFAYRRLSRDDAPAADLEPLEASDAGAGALAPALGVVIALTAGIAIAEHEPDPGPPSAVEQQLPQPD